MAYQDADIIYILTKEDVEMVAQSLGIKRLRDEHYRKARKAVEWFCGGGGYSWSDAIADGLRDAESDLHSSSG